MFLKKNKTNHHHVSSSRYSWYTVSKRFLYCCNEKNILYLYIGGFYTRLFKSFAKSFYDLPFICLVLFGRRANACQINLSTSVELRDRLVAEILFLDTRKSNLILFSRCSYFFFLSLLSLLLLNRPAVDNTHACMCAQEKYFVTNI